MLIMRSYIAVILDGQLSIAAMIDIAYACHCIDNSIKSILCFFLLMHESVIDTCVYESTLVYI
jgi:hypothetical protein